jgi:hypothetical protein
LAKTSKLKMEHHVTKSPFSKENVHQLFKEKKIWRKFCHIRDIRKVRKRQHQYPEFGHTQDEIKEKPAKKYISIQTGGSGRGRLKLRKLSILMVPEFHPAFLFPMSGSSIDFHCSYVYSYYNSSRTLCIKC